MKGSAGQVGTTSDEAAADGGPSWSHEQYQVLRESDYAYFAYVPDSGHSVMIRRAQDDPEARAIPLANEAEGVGVLAGVDLGLGHGVLLMQSGGVGNCANMLSLVKHCGFPFLTIVTMRGDWGEQNPWQYPMGSAVDAVLGAFGVQVMRVDRPEDVVPTTRSAVGAVDRAGRAIAILLSQRLTGVKNF